MKCDNCTKEGATRRGNLVLCDDCAKLKLVQDAAPELLEALQILLRNNELGEAESQRLGLPRMIEAQEIARAAIAKATPSL